MTNNQPHEIFISVDVETSGPIPGEYSLLTLGACVVSREEATFYRKLKPISEKADQNALAVTGLSLDDLARTGDTPQHVMAAFRDWIVQETGEGTPIFVGLNAGFDWSFVNYYFHRFVGENPFGFAPLDIKSLYMGATGCTWRETRSSAMSAVLKPTRHGSHNALDDALAQAELFTLLRTRLRQSQG